MHIRACVEADAEALEASLPSHGAGVHAQLIAAQLNGQVGYLAAWDGPTALGSVLIRWRGGREEEIRAALPGVPEISNLGVAEAFRGHGVGTDLIRAAEDRVRTAGHSRVVIGVGTDNGLAAKLYRRLGYAAVGLVVASTYSIRGPNRDPRTITEHNEVLVREL